MRPCDLSAARPAICTVALLLIALVVPAIATVPSGLVDPSNIASAQGGPPTNPSELSIDVALVVGGMSRLVGITNAGDGTDRLFLLEKVGRVRIVVDGEVLTEPFLDITGRVASRANERGLLGIAFHPNYAENGLFYINYTTSVSGIAPGIGEGDTVVSRFEVSAENPNLADSESESLVIAYEQPYPNHNGGHVLFGPDGYLYIGAGDGGDGGDPENRAQNGRELLGKMLRIDVDVDEGVARPYTIPADNPFVDDPAFEDEIWAYGLRNPWRYAFDSLTGDLYIADVGQSALEEVNFQPADSIGGENYGWRIMEGTSCFSPRTGCRMSGLVLPVAEYGREEGVSVTGGEVYRGQDFPRLKGTYFYADYGRSNVWGLNRDSLGEWRDAIVGKFSFNPSSFGLDENGEIYVVSDAGGNSTLYKMIDAEVEPTEPIMTPDPSAMPTTPVPTTLVPTAVPTDPSPTVVPTTGPPPTEPTPTLTPPPPPPTEPTPTLTPPPPPPIMLPWLDAGR